MSLADLKYIEGLRLTKFQFVELICRGRVSRPLGGEMPPLLPKCLGYCINTIYKNPPYDKTIGRINYFMG